MINWHQVLPHLPTMAVAIAVFGGLAWIMDPKHPERISRLRNKFLTAD